MEKCMSIQIGDKIPSVNLKQLTPSGMQDFSTTEFFANKKVVLFAVPGAFTPTCSAKHLPGYITQLSAFNAEGIEVACMSVNDPFVMAAWEEKHNVTGITMMADGNATFTKALGLEMDGSGYGLGTRSQRFALYAENGVVKALQVEKAGSFDVSSAESMLKTIDSKQAVA
jgi:peroxiredoxin